MKLDLVIGSLEIGGAERQLTGLAIEYSKMGVDVQVVTLTKGGPMLEVLLHHGIHVVRLEKTDGSHGSSIAAFAEIPQELAKLWRRRRPHAVQAWLGSAQVLALPVARALGVPIRIMAIRSLASSVRMSPSKRFGLWLAARSSTAVIANTSAAFSEGGWPVSGRPCHVVANAVTIPESVADSAASPPIGLVLANFIPYKGHSVLLEAIAQITEAPRFRFIGSGPLINQITLQIEQLALHDSVEILEGVEDPWPILLDSQFLVLPSLTEGMPNAVLEGMAAGLPVIASRVGGVPELVDDRKTGLLVSPGNVAELAEAISRIAKDPQFRKTAGDRGRVRAEGFTWRTAAQRNLEIMEIGAG